MDVSRIMRIGEHVVVGLLVVLVLLMGYYIKGYRITKLEKKVEAAPKNAFNWPEWLPRITPPADNEWPTEGL